jgi:hypothetical protein
MTEDEWTRAEAHDVWVALSVLGPRRQRLLGSAAVRSLGRWIDHPVAAAALEASDRFADTRKTKAALKRAWEALSDARVALGPPPPPSEPVARARVLGTYAALFAAGRLCGEANDTAALVIRDAARTWEETEGLTLGEARRRLYQVYREVVGPPDPVVFNPAWRTSTAVQLARQMYESREFGAMPILADALQDAGCESEDVLTHCRDPQAAHVRGCWVVDLVLGKS